MTTATKLSNRQAELLERVCLRRYTVRFSHYMGSFQPNERVEIEEDGRAADWSFRPQTVYALRERGLVVLRNDGPGHSEVRPTTAGLDWMRERLANR